MNTGYCKSNNGLIHRVSAINPEYTLCGNAFEGDGDGTEEGEKHAWEDCPRGPVTCPECIREIENCRGVRTRKGNTHAR